MKYLSLSVTAAVFILIGLVGCWRDETLPIKATPVITEGLVTRIADDTYTIREASGHYVHVRVHKAIMRDRIGVGEYVVVESIGSKAIAIARREELQPIPGTIEGTVAYREGNEYMVEDSSGRRYLLYTDSMTHGDPDIIAGDRVVAVTTTTSSDTPYVTSMSRR